MEMAWDGDELTVFCLALFSSADPAVSPVSPQSSPTSTSQFLLPGYQECRIIRFQIIGRLLCFELLNFL